VKEVPMLMPANEIELAEAVRSAAGALVIRGGGTRSIGRAVAGEVLSVAGLSGITLHEPGALTLVARAGTPLAEVEAMLAQAGQRLAFEPMDHRPLLGTTGTPTIGAVVAANVAGPRRVQVGSARDFLLGLRCVTGSGEVVKSGGRVMKNVTGYDLARLIAGSFGTLAVISEVALKVLPRVEAAATLAIPGLDPAQSVAAMSAALGSPFEVTGAAHDPEAENTYLRIEGFSESVRYRAGRLAGLLLPFGVAAITHDQAEVQGRWDGIRDVTGFAGRKGDVWRISVKPSDAPEITAAARMPFRYDWGGGLIWILAPEGTDLRARIGRFTGHATLIRADAATRAAIATFHPEAPAVAALSRGLRARFDPHAILNPGLMG